MSDIEEGNQGQRHNSDEDVDSNRQCLNDWKEERKNKLELYKAALSNDWKKAETIFRKPGMTYGAIITSRGETALHVAALAGHIDFVQNLVNKMAEEDTTIGAKSSRESGSTAFHYAAISGNVKIAEAIYKKAGKIRDLAIARGNGDNFPIDLASSKGNKEMVRYLYRLNKQHLEDQSSEHLDNEDRTTLLISLIKSDIYDIALEVAKALLNQSEVPENMEVEALTILAEKPLSSVGYMDILNPFSHRHAMNEILMYNKATELIERLWDSVVSDEKKVLALIRYSDPNPILEAAKHGNFDFLTILIASYPDVLFSIDNNNYTIFHHAILNRHVDIFKLINIGSVKTIATMFRDHQGNNMLHLAAKLAPINRLNVVPGAALQLQRELLWFEEVKTAMEPHQVNQKITSSTNLRIQKMLNLFEEMKMEIDQISGSNILFKEIKNLMEQYDVSGNYHSSNAELQRVLMLFEEMKKVTEQYESNEKKILKEEYTPNDIFFKEHKELMIEGEKWMRDTANSCMIVAVLITTIAFAAAITVPGGNGNDGYPNFSSEVLFKAFSIADSISMISSATSLLDFLSILTARYTIDDFRWSLPNKLVIGLSTLFISIVAMMVAFVLSIFIIFKNSPVWFAVVIAAVSSVPIVLFIWQHLSLFVDVFRSTYTSYLLFKSKRDPSLLFKENKKFISWRFLF